MPATINVEAEKRALVTVLDGEPDISASLLSRLTEDHFGLPESQQCMLRIGVLQRNNQPLPSLDVFADDPTLTEDTKLFLREGVSTSLTKPEDVESTLKVLSFHSKFRKLVTGLKAVSKTIKDDKFDSISTPTDQLEKLVMELRAGDAQNTNLVIAGAGDSSHADEIVGRIIAPDDTTSRIYTGFGYFDRMCGGFRKPSVVVIAGTTGGGKSVMRTQLCRNMYYDQGLSTCIVSFEMSEEEEMTRLLSNISKVPHDKIDRHQMSAVQSGAVLNAWEDFKEVGREKDARFIFWTPQGVNLTAANIITQLKPFKLDVVVIDYIGLLSNGGKEEAQWEGLGNMAREFKTASSALGCCFIILAQFDGDNNRIKYSRAIQEHANVLWGWVYGDKEKETGIVQIQQIKNRNAASNIDFRLQFLLEIMTIKDYEGAGSGDQMTPRSPPSKPLNSGSKAGPPKDFKSMRTEVGKFAKAHTYKPAHTPGSGDL